jgi:hypothetical protein
MTHASDLRESMQALPNLAVTSTGKPPEPGEVFFPESHAEVLDPDVSLVIGNRGMGKTFWALALADEQLRSEIGSRYVRLRKWKIDGLQVYLGFADAEGGSAIVSRADLESVEHLAAPEDIWRAVYIRAVEGFQSKKLPKTFSGLVRWVSVNKIEQRELFRAVDQNLSTKDQRVLLVFDQLDQLADDWGRIQDLTKGLLKLALALKSYKNLKIKLFMRPDQAENRDIFSFPDASKVAGGGRVLTWRPSDLYGLLFFEVCRIPAGKRAFSTLCRSIGINPERLHVRLQIPDQLAKDSSLQGKLFDEMAGSMMGKGLKRGRPFTWIPTHLADARGEISPRTFLHVIKTAAEHDDPEPRDSAIDFNGIQEGVRRASANRLTELEEDYPWVSLALEPLKGLLVPCLATDILGRWEKFETVGNIRFRFRGRRAPISLGVGRKSTATEAAMSLLRVLSEIGVVEERDNGKLNLPDIFRVKAGVLRKGGVAPHKKKAV